MLKLKKVKLTVAIVLLTLVTVVLYAWSYCLCVDSFMPWWVPAVAVVVVAGATLPFYVRWWRWLTGSDSLALNALCHVLVAGAAGCFAVCGGNYYGAAGEEYAVSVKVVDKKAELKDTYRRVGRHRRVKSGTRTEYKVSVIFPDGEVMTWPVGCEKYNRIRIGSEREAVMRDGLLGYPVVSRRPI